MAVGKGEGGGEREAGGGSDRAVDESVMEKSAKSQGSAFIWSRFQQLAKPSSSSCFLSESVSYQDPIGQVYGNALK